MQPTCKHVPPRNGSFSTTTVFSPSSPARIAATYPPGPLPIIATSYFATLSLPSAGPRCRVRNLSRAHFAPGFDFRSRTSLRPPAHAGGCRSAPFYPSQSGGVPANFEFAAVVRRSKSGFAQIPVCLSLYGTLNLARKTRPGRQFSPNSAARALQAKPGQIYHFDNRMYYYLSGIDISLFAIGFTSSHITCPLIPGRIVRPRGQRTEAFHGHASSGTLALHQSKLRLHLSLLNWEVRRTERTLAAPAVPS